MSGLKTNLKSRDRDHITSRPSPRLQHKAEIETRPRSQKIGLEAKIEQ